MPPARHLFVLFLALATSAPAAAQFAAGFGGTGNVLGHAGAIGPDGTTYVAGAFAGTIGFRSGVPLSSAGSRDVFVGAYGPEGEPLWGFRVGGPGLDGATGVAPAPNGEVCVTGLFEGPVDFDPTAAGELVLVSNGVPGSYTWGGFVARYRPDGTPVYARRLQGSNSDQTATSVFTDAQGRCVVGGEFTGTLDLETGALSANGRDGYVARFEADGSASLGLHVSGPGQTRLVALDRNDTDGRFCAAGSFAGTTAFGPGPDDTLTASGLASYVACYSADGAFAFARPVTGTIDVRGVTVDGAGRPAISGDFFGEIEIDGQTVTSPGVRSGFVAAYDAVGSGRFGFALGGSGLAYTPAVAAGADGVLSVGGAWSGPIDFDPGPGTAEASAADLDVYVARYASDGAFLDVRRSTGAADDVLTAFDVGPDGTLGLFGIYRQGFAFDTGDGDETLQPFAGSASGYVVRARLGDPVSAEAAPAAGIALAIAPNPSAGAATVRLAVGAPGDATVMVFDALGRRVAVLHAGPLAAGAHAWALPHLAPGLYVVRAATADGATHRTLSIVR